MTKREREAPPYKYVFRKDASGVVWSVVRRADGAVLAGGESPGFRAASRDAYRVASALAARKAFDVDVEQPDDDEPPTPWS